jgi:hypothetical protein
MRGVFLLLLMGGCAIFPVSEPECRVSDWQRVGYEHGYWGYHPQDLRLVPECRERYGVEVNVAEYMAGWRDGHDEWYRTRGSIDRRR